MSHQNPPGKTGTLAPSVEWRERQVTTRGIRFGGVWYAHQDLEPWIGFSMEVLPATVGTLMVRYPGTDDPNEWLMVDSLRFDDPDAVDSFLALRDAIPKPPYRPFFSTTKVVDHRDSVASSGTADHQVLHTPPISQEVDHQGGSDGR